MLPTVENRFVELAVVAKKFVVVAEVPVPVVNVRAWRVVEPVCKVLEKVESPAVAVKVPGKV